MFWGGGWHDDMHVFELTKDRPEGTTSDRYHTPVWCVTILKARYENGNMWVPLPCVGKGVLTGAIICAEIRFKWENPVGLSPCWRCITMLGEECWGLG